MAIPAELAAVLSKLEAADIPILEASLLPALLDLGVSLLPAGTDQTIAKEVETVALPFLQTGLTSLLSKIPTA